MMSSSPTSDNDAVTALLLQRAAAERDAALPGSNSFTAQSLLLLRQRQQLNDLLAVANNPGTSNSLPTSRSSSILAPSTLGSFEALRRASAASSSAAVATAAANLVAGEVSADDSENERVEEDKQSDEEYFNDYNSSKESEEEGKAANESFPHKLYRMLFEIEKDGLGHIVSFLPSGRGFTIHKSKEFVNVVMPRYFTTRRIASFQRQLNLYGFRRINDGNDKGAYHHKDFLKGKRGLLSKIKRKVTNVPRPPPAFAGRFMVGHSAIYPNYGGLGAASLVSAQAIAARRASTGFPASAPTTVSKELLMAQLASGARAQPNVGAPTSAAASLVEMARQGLLSTAATRSSLGLIGAPSHANILRNAAASLLLANRSNNGTSTGTNNTPPF